MFDLKKYDDVKLKTMPLKYCSVLYMIDYCMWLNIARSRVCRYSFLLEIMV